jgi:hypothetical protein
MNLNCRCHYATSFSFRRENCFCKDITDANFRHYSGIILSQIPEIFKGVVFCCLFWFLRHAYLPFFSPPTSHLKWLYCCFPFNLLLVLCIVKVLLIFGNVGRTLLTTNIVMGNELWKFVHFVCVWYCGSFCGCGLKNIVL